MLTTILDLIVPGHRRRRGAIRRAQLEQAAQHQAAEYRAAAERLRQQAGKR